MPHLTVEYSANLEEQINVMDLLRKIHEAALATGVFEVGAVRTRAARREHYVIADGHTDNSFVAITARIAPGRDAETRKRLGQAIFDAACNYLEKVYQKTPIGISLEVHEIDNSMAYRKNNLHMIVKNRAAKAPA